MPEMVRKTINQAFDETVTKWPNKEAFIFNDRKYTYLEIKEKVDALANGLVRIGVRKGDKVSIWMSNRPEWMISKFAISKIGAIMVPINTRYKKSELEYILKQSDSTTLIMMDHFLTINYLKILKDICENIDTSLPGKLQLNRLQMLRNIVVLAREVPKGCYKFSELLKCGAKLSYNKDIKEIQKLIAPDDIVNIQYTSGTTGFPKGAMLSHDMVAHMLSVGNRMKFTSNDCLMIPNPFFHVFGSICGILLTVAHGGTIATIEYFDPEMCLKTIEFAKATAIHGVPTMFHMQIEHSNFPKYDVSSLRTGVIGGTSCPVALMKKIINKMHLPELTSVYGITETSSCTTQSFIGDSEEIVAKTVGKPLPQLEYKIIDPSIGEEVPAGCQGEFCVRGPMVMKGYYKMPEETREALDEDGWFHTGDILTQKEDGNFVVKGRIKEMFIVGGENTYPVEIENFLSKYKKVKQVCVVGVPDERLGEIGMAFIDLQEGGECSEEEIIEYCRGKIANYKIPKYVEFVNEFPMTASGKIKKYELKNIGIRARML